MKPAVYDLPIRQGNDALFTFTFEGSDGGILDLTGSTLVWTAQTSAGTLLEKSTPTELEMTDPETGTVTLALTPAETRLFEVGRHNRWEIERRYLGDEQSLVTGFMVVEKGYNTDAE